MHCIDSHKLNYHPQSVAAWMGGERIYPLYVELSPSGACNHRCQFCALDYVGYKKRFLDTNRTKRLLSEMASLGVRAVMFGGEGEPFMHPELSGLVGHASEEGLDVAITTNGTLFNEPSEILPYCTWIKFSVNAGSRKTYAEIHRTPKESFETVLENIDRAASFRATYGLSCAIGVQMLLLPENASEVTELSRLSQSAGADYLVVKQYSQHGSSKTTKYNGFTCGVDIDDFVIYRKPKPHREYDKCLALPFWAYIDSGGGVCGCSAYLGEDEFSYGNINLNSFKDIWDGRKEPMVDVGKCRPNCRMHECNNYLWGVTHPPEHYNFI